MENHFCSVYLPRKFLFLILALWQLPAFAHQYSIEPFRTEHGLVQSQVFSLFQDRKGNLWIATWGGVSKYDGISFQNFTGKNGLITERIFSITEDENGSIYFGTKYGLFVFNGKTFDTITTKDGLTSNEVTKLYRDKKGNMWIGTQNGITLYDGKKFTPFEPATFNQKKVWAILEDNDDNIWFGTQGSGIFRLDKRQQLTNFTEEDGLTSNIIWDIYEDANKSILFGTASGVSKFQSGRISSFTDKALSGEVIYAVTQDEDGYYWLGSRAMGAIKYREGIIEYISDNEGLTNKNVKTLLYDREGNLWMGTLGGGLYKLKPKAFYSLNIQDGLSDNTVWSIAKNPAGEILFGTSKGVNAFDGKKMEALSSPYFTNPVWSIQKTRDNTLWFGSNGMGLIRYNGKSFVRISENEGFNSERNPFLYEDKKDNLWIGTYSNGLYKYDGKTFTNYTEENGLKKGEITSIFDDLSGNIWITGAFGVYKFDGEKFTPLNNGKLSIGNILCGTSDKYGNIILGTSNGLIIYSSKTNEQVNINSEKGLVDDAIAFLLFDDYENLWIGTNRGIDKFYYKKYLQDKAIYFKHYGKEEGFVGLECTPNAAFKDEEGALWFGSAMGAYKYLPEYDKTNTVVPATIIQSIRLNYEQVDWKKYTDSISATDLLPFNLELPWDKNHLTFDFIGISLAYSGKVKYQFKLDGFDPNWQPITNKREATYTYLPPGNYTFQVRASNNEGKWNKIPTTFSFTIKKPFWQENWFYAAVIITLVLLIYSLIRLRTRSLLQQRKELEVQVTKRTEELREAKDRAERSEKAKEEFLANMSHEIRTPMNAVMGMSSLLIKTPLNEKQQKFVNTIRISSENLLVIINDILDLSKIEAGKIPLESIEFNLKEIYDNLLLTLEHRADERQNKLLTDIHPEVPSYVVGDPVRLNQVLLNLMGNAIKFTEKGTVTLSAEVLSEDDKKINIRFAVTDTGIGIAGDKIDSIFAPFTQERSDTTRKFGGTGLGLTISKKLVELQGGTIQVNSQISQGSTFSFNIIFKKAAPKAKEETVEKITEESVELINKKIKILLVDDNDFNQMVATDLIKDWNPEAEIDVADNGKIAVEKVEANNYDIVLMDVQMPEMDGYEATQIIRKINSPKSKIPIVAMTAHAIDSEIKKCREMGMDEYVAKPIEPPKLFSKITALVNSQLLKNKTN